MQAETTEVPKKADVRHGMQRHASARARVLARLNEGSATNVELNDICYRYGARILELRQQGYAIRTTPVSRGLFSYRLE